MNFKQQIDLDDIKGVVELELLNHKGRVALVKRMNTDTKKDVKFGGNELDLAEKIEDEVIKQVKSVKLKVKETDKEINSLAELEYYSVYSQLINELIGVLAHGAQLGKQKKKV